mgnify:CR=1 FL=1
MTLPTIPPLVAGKKPEETTVVAAMSGGVDSSVVAAWLHKLGYKVIGITLQLWDYTPAQNEGADKKFGTCCALDDVYDARRVCQTVGFPHYVLNYESEFKDKVIDDFVDTYLAGATPIPCVRCNQRIKFDSLLEKAKKLGGDVLVTGHYVRKVVNEKGQAELRQGLSDDKDQSYYLFTTTPEQLEYSAFPLGDMTKEETRALADEMNLHVKSKPDSQDICFVPGGDYRKVVRKFAPEAEKSGNFVNSRGEVLGTHSGIINFTVGQRRGLGIAFGEPMYVTAIRPETSEVVLGPKEELGVKTFMVKDLNWLMAPPGPGEEITVRVRAGHKGVPGELEVLDDGRVQVSLFNPEEAVSPGQAAVFYSGRTLLGGGWIENPHAGKSSGKVRINISAA